MYNTQTGKMVDAKDLAEAIRMNKKFNGDKTEKKAGAEGWGAYEYGEKQWQPMEWHVQTRDDMPGIWRRSKSKLTSRDSGVAPALEKFYKKLKLNPTNRRLNWRKEASSKQAGLGKVTVDSLLRGFPDLTEEEAKDIEEAVSRAHNPGHVYDAMRLFDKLTGGFGVEAVESSEWAGGHYDNIVAKYVEHGDLYNLTLLYDVGRRKFYLTSVGGWREREERKGDDVDKRKLAMKLASAVVEALDGMTHYGAGKNIGDPESEWKFRKGVKVTAVGGPNKGKKGKVTKGGWDTVMVSWGGKDPVSENVGNLKLVVEYIDRPLLCVGPHW